MAYRFLKPIHDKVVIKPYEPSRRQGSILRPELGNDAPQMGTIIAIGEGSSFQFRDYVPTTLKVGDLVLVPRVGVTQVVLDDETYYICREVDILAPIEEITNP